MRLLPAAAPPAIVRLVRFCSDDRKYRAVTLANGLTAMVVHDPEADQGAACLSVGVGHLCDPVRRFLSTVGRRCAGPSGCRADGRQPRGCFNRINRYRGTAPCARLRRCFARAVTLNRIGVCDCAVVSAGGRVVPPV